ncbi:hypothetical protein ACS15_4711 [Ralstonia insidiosa]|uniref:Uncharacterized protein n=1 Tax=Ralstonia insidiosa TaxID=190721 RepID=A0AAC9FUE7_9RALS|nr:hypothetical protein ACS15_4711 [Ralstonia insidiosa]
MKELPHAWTAAVTKEGLRRCIFSDHTAVHENDSVRNISGESHFVRDN